jgi:very-short-patch-repair endonuclease
VSSMDFITFLSHCESYAERCFATAAWPMLEGIEAQVQVGDYRADFAWNGLIIEVDGKRYHGAPEQMQRDRKRDERIGSYGWRILRFGAGEVIDNPAACVAEILATPEPLPFDGVWTT